MKKVNNNKDLESQEELEEKEHEVEEPKEADLERIKQLELELHNLKKRIAGQDISIEKERQQREQLEKQVARYKKIDELINFSQFNGILNLDLKASLNNGDRYIEQAEKKAGLLKNGELSFYMETIKSSMGVERWKTFLLTKLTEGKKGYDKEKKRSRYI